MTVIVILCYFIIEYTDTFKYLTTIIMFAFSFKQILTQYFEYSVVLVINIYPELNTDF